MQNWLLLHYRLPAHPTALRVYTWRKLKRLGAVLLQNAVWILPDTPRTAEHLQWLAAEIQERRGEVLLWRSNLILGLPEEALLRIFLEQVDQEYAGLLQQMKRKHPDFAGLSRRYQQIQGKDYFGSKPGRQVREKLIALRGEKE